MARSVKDRRPASGRHTAASRPAAEKAVLAAAEPLARDLCLAAGMELVHIEFQRERSGRVMRLYIDKPGGIGLEDCAAVSRELGDLLDVHLPEIGPYHLEVSSPGPERPLGRLEDFERFRGRPARIRTRVPIDGRRTFSGMLAGVKGQAVRIAVGADTLSIPAEEIAKANLIQTSR